MKKSSKKTNLGKKAIMSALALSVGAAASALAVDKALGDPLFSLKEIGNQTLIAHEEGKCGEGKCGEGKASAKARESKCGLSKIKSLFKKAEGKKVAKKAESKAGEGKCGEGKCGEGKCGSK